MWSFCLSTYCMTYEFTSFGYVSCFKNSKYWQQLCSCSCSSNMTIIYIYIIYIYIYTDTNTDTNTCTFYCTQSVSITTPACVTAQKPLCRAICLLRVLSAFQFVCIETPTPRSHGKNCAAWSFHLPSHHGDHVYQKGWRWWASNDPVEPPHLRMEWYWHNRYGRKPAPCIIFQGIPWHEPLWSLYQLCLLATRLPSIAYHSRN